MAKTMVDGDTWQALYVIDHGFSLFLMSGAHREATKTQLALALQRRFGHQIGATRQRGFSSFGPRWLLIAAHHLTA